MTANKPNVATNSLHHCAGPVLTYSEEKNRLAKYQMRCGNASEGAADLHNDVRNNVRTGKFFCQASQSVTAG